MEQQQQNHANGSTRDPLEILRQLKSEVFEDSVQQLALGLGRPEEQVTGWLNGGSEIDEDGVEKINGLATMRLAAVLRQLTILWTALNNAFDL
jgi:hypothetical protein